MSLVQIGDDIWVRPDRVLSVHRKGGGGAGYMVHVDMGTYTATFEPEWPMDRVVEVIRQAINMDVADILCACREDGNHEDCPVHPS